jgi:hypothetical protein
MGTLLPVQDALGVVIFIVVILGAILAVASLVNRDDLYDQIGRGGLSIRDEPPRSEPQPGSVAHRVEQEEEVRQMVEARSARHVRRGQPPLDIDAEVARLLEPAAGPAPLDPGLREEIRGLVVARNERRARMGKPPLDVETEIDRQLRDLA